MSFICRTSIVVLALSSALFGCSELLENPNPRVGLPEVGLSIAPLKGWVLGEKTALPDPAKGGVLLSMHPKTKPPGAPTFQIFLGPLRVKSPSLETLVKEQWTRMETVAQQPGITVTKLARQSTTILSKEAVVLEHTYSLGTGPAQISVSEHAWITEWEERGLAFVLAGRTELLTPWLEQIQTMLAGIEVQIDTDKKKSHSETDTHD